MMVAIMTRRKIEPLTDPTTMLVFDEGFPRTVLARSVGAGDGSVDVLARPGEDDVLSLTLEIWK
jgi:hypothetical protein